MSIRGKLVFVAINNLPQMIYYLWRSLYLPQKSFVTGFLWQNFNLPQNANLHYIVAKVYATNASFSCSGLIPKS